MIPKVPQEVPVANAIKQLITKIIAGNRAGDQVPLLLYLVVANPELVDLSLV